MRGNSPVRSAGSEESFQISDSLQKGIVLHNHNEVDGIEIGFAAKTSTEVGFRVDGGIEFAAEGA